MHQQRSATMCNRPLHTALKTLHEVAATADCTSDRRLGDVVQADRFVAHVDNIHKSACVTQFRGVVAEALQDILIRFMQLIPKFAEQESPTNHASCEHHRHHAHGDCSTSAQASPFYIGVGLCIGILKCRYCRGVWCATSEKIGAKSLGPLLESARQHPSTSVQGAALQYLSTWLNYPETAYLLRQWQPQEPDSLMESLLHSLAHPAMPVAAAAGNVCVGLINGNWPFTEDCFAIVFENLHPKKSVDVQRSTLTFVENVMCSSLSEENYSLLEETVSAQSMNEFCKESKDSLVHQCDEVDTATEGADIDESPKSTTSGTLRCNQLWFLPMVQYAVHYGLFSQDKLVIHHCINILSSLVAQSQRLSIAAPNWLNEVFLDSDATHRVGRLDTTLLFQSKGSLVFVLMKKLLCTHNQHQIPTLMHLAAALFDVAKMPPEWRQRLWKVVVLPLVRPLQRNTPRRSVDVCNTADAFASVYEMFGRELDADSHVHRKALLASLDVLYTLSQSQHGKTIAEVTQTLKAFVYENYRSLRQDDLVLRKLLRIYQEIIRRTSENTSAEYTQINIVADLIAIFTRLFCPSTANRSTADMSMVSATNTAYPVDGSIPCSSVDQEAGSVDTYTSPLTHVSSQEAAEDRRGLHSTPDGLNYTAPPLFHTVPSTCNVVVEDVIMDDASTDCTMDPTVVLQSLAALATLWSVLVPVLGSDSVDRAHVDILLRYVCSACDDANWDIRETAINCINQLLPKASSGTTPRGSTASMIPTRAEPHCPTETTRVRTWLLTDTRFNLALVVWRKYPDASQAVRAAVLAFAHSLLLFDTHLFRSVVQEQSGVSGEAKFGVPSAGASTGTGGFVPYQSVLGAVLAGLRDDDLDVRRNALALCAAMLTHWHQPRMAATVSIPPAAPVDASPVDLADVPSLWHEDTMPAPHAASSPFPQNVSHTDEQAPGSNRTAAAASDAGTNKVNTAPASGRVCPLESAGSGDNWNAMSCRGSIYHQVLQHVPTMMDDEDWEIKLVVLDIVDRLGIEHGTESDTGVPCSYCSTCASVFQARDTLARGVDDHDSMVQQRACAILLEWAASAQHTGDHRTVALSACHELRDTKDSAEHNHPPRTGKNVDQGVPHEEDLGALAEHAFDVMALLRASVCTDDPAIIDDWNDVFEPDWRLIPPGLDDESEDLAFALETGLRLSNTRDCY